MNLQSLPNRDFSIDTLRTLGALLVILLHVSAGYITDGKGIILGNSFVVANIFNSFSRVAVPIFVLISGRFIIPYKGSISKFYIKRASRILLPFLFWVASYSLCNVLYAYLSGNDLSYKQVMVDIVLGNTFYHLWYMYMLIGLYLFAPLISYLQTKISRRNLWCSAFLLLFIGMTHQLFNFWQDNQFFTLFWFMDYLGYFMLGYLIKDMKTYYSSTVLVLTYIFSSTLTAGVTYYTAHHLNNLYFYNYLSPLVIIGSLSFYTLFHQLQIRKNPLSNLSYLTLGVYLIHPAVLTIINLGTGKPGLVEHSYAYIEILLKFIVVTVISMLIAYGFSKTKLLNRFI